MPVLNVNFSLRPLMERLRKELSRLEANSAFPLASALPSLTFCFLTPNLVCNMLECVNVCVCECVSCVASGVNAQKPGWAVLKARGRGAAEGFCDNPWNQGEGERVFIWID